MVLGTTSIQTNRLAVITRFPKQPALASFCWVGLLFDPTKEIGGCLTSESGAHASEMTYEDLWKLVRSDMLTNLLGL